MDKTLKQAVLKAHCINRGLPVTGTKSVLVERLRQGLRLPVPNPSKIVSLDLGQRNCAVAVMQRSPEKRLLSWCLHDIPLPMGADPHGIAAAAERFYADSLSHELDGTSLLVMERQRHRSAGSPMVLETVMRTILLETALVVLARGHTISILPRAVAMYYGLPSNTNGKREKKKAAIQLIRSRLHELSEEHKRYFEGSKKKDDLADALLQAWAVIDWIDVGTK